MRVCWSESMTGVLPSNLSHALPPSVKTSPSKKNRTQSALRRANTSASGPASPAQDVSSTTRGPLSGSTEIQTETEGDSGMNYGEKETTDENNTEMYFSWSRRMVWYCTCRVCVFTQTFYNYTQACSLDALTCL